MVQAAGYERDGDGAEQAAMSRVVERLASQFPEVPREDIARAVRGRYEGYEPSPVRDFLPILVERSVREDLGGRLGKPYGT